VASLAAKIWADRESDVATHTRTMTRATNQYDVPPKQGRCPRRRSSSAGAHGVEAILCPRSESELVLPCRREKIGGIPVACITKPLGQMI
jgi:hypothetical protein